jgi:hypothetical protein
MLVGRGGGGFRVCGIGEVLYSYKQCILRAGCAAGEIYSPGPI